MSALFLPFPEVGEEVMSVAVAAPAPAEPLPVVTTPTVSPKARAAAEKCRQLADALQKQIDAKYVSAMSQLQSPTAKRVREAEAASKAVLRFDNYQAIFRVMADQHESGTIDPALAKVTSLAAMSRAHMDGLAPMMSIYNSLNLQERPDIRNLMAEATAMLSGIPGFFPTPSDVIQELLDALLPFRHEDSFLEPSAGSGRLIDAVLQRVPTVPIAFCEFNWGLRAMLTKKYADRPNVHLLTADFEDVSVETTPSFSRIIMNPPFEKGADAEHVMKAYNLLAPGGKLAAVMSEGPFSRNDKRSQAFRAWLEGVNAVTSRLPENSFRSSGTGVSCRILRVEKEPEWVRRIRL